MCQEEEDFCENASRRGVEVRAIHTYADRPAFRRRGTRQLIVRDTVPYKAN